MAVTFDQPRQERTCAPLPRWHRRSRAFTLLPGRIMNKVVFTYPEGWSDAGRIAIFLAIIASMLLLLVLSRLAAPGGLFGKRAPVPERI
jgi:hypothetical protein